MKPIQVGGITIGAGAPLVLLAGPCVIESENHAVETALAVRDIARRVGVPYVFKASYDKANRTSAASFRGPGLREGIRVLARVREAAGVPIVTDIHEPSHAEPAATVADIGSGAGIPGLPLAIALPTARFTLLEPRRGRISFLEAAVDELQLSNVIVPGARAEDVSDHFQACVARAFSSPISTWEAAEPLLAPGGVLVYWAGERFERALLDDLGVPSRLSTHSDLARSGPLVIMGPQ